MKRAVDNGLDDGWTKDTLYWMMGWGGEEPEGGPGEVEGLTGGGEHKDARATGLAKLRKSDQEKTKKFGSMVGGNFGKQDYQDSLDKMSDEQIAEQLQLLKQKAQKRGLEFNKVQETEKIPDPHQADPWEGTKIPGQNINTSNVNMTTFNNLAVLEPAAAHG